MRRVSRLVFPLMGSEPRTETSDPDVCTLIGVLNTRDEIFYYVGVRKDPPLTSTGGDLSTRLAMNFFF